jgi:hypothetical protein
VRRLLVIAAACTAALALPAAASAQPLQRLHGTGPVVTAGANQRAPRNMAKAGRVVPLGRSLTGTGTLSLNVLTFGGSAEVGAGVGWDVFTDTGFGFGSSTTDASGHIDFTGVPAASANGELFIGPASENALYDLFGLSWPAAGMTPPSIQPGHMPVTITRSSDSGYNDWSDALVELRAVTSDGTFSAITDVANTGDVTNGVACTMSDFGASTTLTEGTVRFWPNEGLELNVAGTTVTPGTTTAAQAADETDAHAVWMDGWASGKPGTTDWLAFERFPAGWANQVTGYADYPDTSAVKTFGTWTAAGQALWAQRITIPATVKPGYQYWIDVNHQDGPLSLETSFQTCTLNASKTTIRRSTPIKLSGIVPIKNHYGSQPGVPSHVLLYKTTSLTTARNGQPGRAGGAAKIGGWTRVATYKTTGLGKFTTGYLKPTRTTWYVLWYPHVTGQYWGAWTSLRKVIVR